MAYKKYKKRKPGSQSMESNNNSKLTTRDVSRIKSLKKKGLTSSEIAKRVGTTPDNIRNITTGRTWAKKGKKKKG